MPADNAPGESSNLVVEKFNFRVAELIRKLEPQEVVEVLSGAGSFVRASNQNQNQNGSRRPNL